MAFSAYTRQWLLLVSTMIYIFVFTSKFGKANYYYPRLGAVGLVANEYVPEAEDEGETNDDHYYPQTGVVGNDPGLVFDKALECLNDKYIYTSCDEAYRLNQNGELNIPHEYTNQYCSGPCLKETQLVLECIDGVLKHFVFYNKATLRDVRETIEEGCSYGPKRGDFNVAEHINTDEAFANRSFNPTIYYALVVMIMGWHALF